MPYLAHSDLLAQLGASDAEQRARLDEAEARLRAALGSRPAPQTLEGFGHQVAIVKSHLEALAAQAHMLRTGGTRPVRSDVLELVDAYGSGLLIDVERARAHVNGSDRGEVEATLAAITTAILDRTGRGPRRRWREVFEATGVRVLALRRRPVEAVDLAVTVNGLAVSDYEIRLDTGELVRAAGWHGRVEVLYNAGHAEIPGVLEEAALLALEERATRLGGVQVRDAGKVGAVLEDADAAYLPGSVLDLLAPMIPRDEASGIDVERLAQAAGTWLEEVRASGAGLPVAVPMSSHSSVGIVERALPEHWRRRGLQ